MKTERPAVERVSAEQIRAARGWLGWSQADLATNACVGRKTIAEVEAKTTIPYERTLRDIREAFERAGLEFIFDQGTPTGIRFRQPPSS